MVGLIIREKGIRSKSPGKEKRGRPGRDPSRFNGGAHPEGEGDFRVGKVLT